MAPLEKAQALQQIIDQTAIPSGYIERQRLREEWQAMKKPSRDEPNHGPDQGQLKRRGKRRAGRPINHRFPYRQGKAVRWDRP